MGCPHMRFLFAGLFTANSMNCLCEALGMALPGNGTILADRSAPRRSWPAPQQRQIMDLDWTERPANPGTSSRLAAIDDAFALDMAMGGSDQHDPAHAWPWPSEAGIEYSLWSASMQISAYVCPTLCKVSPSSNYHMQDVDKAGGISAILWELNKRAGYPASGPAHGHRQDDGREYRRL